MTTDKEDRSIGALLGLACGDALGRPVEFKLPSTIQNEHGTLTDMVGHGTHRQPAGTITDDTDLALCIARSRVDRGGFDGKDIARRFIEWYDSGPFDIGRMTSGSIRRLKDGESWEAAGINEWEASPEGSNAGNGSLMRTVPNGVADAGDPEAIITNSHLSSAITHADPRCQASCAIFNLMVSNLIHGDDLFDSVLPTYRELGSPDAGNTDQVLSLVEDVESGETTEDDIQSTGYVIHTFQTALYHTVTADTAEDAIIRAVNMGGDADTIGAVTGALVGARDGVSALPDRWLNEIDEADELRELATQLHD